MNRELVMLAKTLEANAQVSGLYMSTKLDGQRALWDGGITRGMSKEDVPWANTAKDERLRSRQICTGLWSRYGNVIHAPSYFLDALPPNIFLDGELYLGRGRFQESRSIVSTHEPGPGWRDIRYHVFDMPPPRMIFSGGKINNPNFSKYISEEECLDVLRRKIKGPDLRVRSYKDILPILYSLKGGKYWTAHPQVLLPQSEDRARELMLGQLEYETKQGGEGLMLRDPESIWTPKRMSSLLKVKKLEMDSGRIIGYESGMGKLRGMFGALIVEWQGKTFKLSGFTDSERVLSGHDAIVWAQNNEGVTCPDWINALHFPRGVQVRFTYMSITDDGKPREARYLR